MNDRSEQVGAFVMLLICSILIIGIVGAIVADSGLPLWPVVRPVMLVLGFCLGLVLFLWWLADKISGKG